MRGVEAWLGVALTGIALVGCGGGGGGSTTSTATGSGRSPSTGSSTASVPTESTSTGGETANAPARSGRKRGPACAACSASASPSASAKAVLTASDPAVACGVLVTGRYLRAAYGGEQGCAGAVRGGSGASSVRIASIKPEGRFALVVAVPHGGASDGEKLAISMIREPAKLPNGQTEPLWRVDAVHSNVKVGP